MACEEKVYDQMCTSYRGIDDFRAKLLGFLPLATGAGILFTAKEGQNLLKDFSQPIAVFGFLITLGLFCYEIYGVTKCAELIRTGKKIELAQNVQGQFVSRPQAVFGFINEPFAAGVIYPAVLASWKVLWFVRGDAKTCLRAWVIAGLVFAGGLAFTLIYDCHLKRGFKTKCDGCTRPFECGESARTRITTLETSPDYWLCDKCSKALTPWLRDRRLQ